MAQYEVQIKKGEQKQKRSSAIESSSKGVEAIVLSNLAKTFDLGTLILEFD